VSKDDARDDSPVPVLRRRRKKAPPREDRGRGSRRPSRPGRSDRRAPGGRRGSRRSGGSGPSPARVAAALALVKVDQGAHVEDELARLAPADPRDRGHAWFLALGVLRHRASVDAALRPLLKRPLGGLDPEVRAVLRLGTFEKLHGRAADHAVVHESVDVVKAIGGARASGLVNAVLRKVRPVPLSDEESLEHPSWLLARWTARYGHQATQAWARANNEPAPVSVVTADPSLQASLSEAGVQTEPVQLGERVLPGVLRLVGPEGPITALPGFDEGRFWVQDPAAVAVADLVLGDAPAEGLRVLDACAAPGGKTFRLLSRGAQVTAVDNVGARLQRIREGLARLGLTATLRHHDWTQGPLPDAGGPFDAVLVDAPCTGLGTVRRHPEIRWRRQLVDVLSMPELQGTILESAATHVAPGGRLIYAVCSPEPEEGEGVVQAFLQAHPEFEREQSLSTAPPAGDEDAHVAVVMRRG